jgi:hypothetical protein
VAGTKIGQLWARRDKRGKTFLAGYIWPFPGRVYTVKVSLNVMKTDKTQPDYIIHDYSVKEKYAKQDYIPGKSPGLKTQQAGQKAD